MNTEAVKTFYDLLGHKKQTEIRAISVYGFVGQFVSNPEIFQVAEVIVQKDNLILYNGSFKSYKKYHITLKSPNLSEKILPFENSEIIREATITGLSIFSDKMVYLLDNKKHITIAEGDKQKLQDTLNSNKKDFEKLIGIKVFFANPEFIFANPSKNKVQSYFVSSEEEFISKVQELNGKYNLYAGLNERIEQGTEATDVISVKRIFADIDCIIKPASAEDLQEAEKVTDEIISVIEKQTGLRATKIYSGNGYQLVFCIPEIEITEANREEVEAQVQQFLKDLIKKYSNDKVKLDNVGDLPRIIRITATTNIKGGKASEFVEIHKEENSKLRDYILSLKPETAQLTIGELETSLADLLKDNEEINKLYSGNISGFDSRSEAEESLIFRLVQAGLNREQLFQVMAHSKIGKWNEAHQQYRERSYISAIEMINKSKKVLSNPFKKLHYATQHLKHFEEFNLLLGLYGKHYLPIKKARWYQLLGGVIQKKIKIGEKLSDTRINCIYPLPTEAGKNDIIYLFKNIITQIQKSPENNFSIEEPISYHPEQLVGKVIEIMIDNPSGNKPKKIPVKHENRGYFNSDFLEIDEANLLFFSKDEQIKQAREYISKALNPIDRNEIVKKLVDDLPEERVAYCPKCTITLYFQPKKMEEELMLQGFLRRFLIPVGSIEPFLNYGSEEDFKKKTNKSEFSKQEKREILIEYLSKVRESLKDKNFTFTEEATEKINYYLQYLLAEGQLHSERISSLTKIIKWTIQDYLIRMSCILAGSFYQNIVTENHVALAYMDLAEFLQSHFDFISEWLYGNFDYGVAYKGADYGQRMFLKGQDSVQSLSHKAIYEAGFEAGHKAFSKENGCYGLGHREALKEVEKLIDEFELVIGGNSNWKKKLKQKLTEAKKSADFCSSRSNELEAVK